MKKIILLVILVMLSSCNEKSGGNNNTHSYTPLPDIPTVVSNYELSPFMTDNVINNNSNTYSISIKFLDDTLQTSKWCYIYTDDKLQKVYAIKSSRILNVDIYELQCFKSGNDVEGNFLQCNNSFLNLVTEGLISGNKYSYVYTECHAGEEVLSAKEIIKWE